MTNLDLEKLNQVNVATPGLITFVTNDVGDVIPIFNLEEFDPEKHSISISQIWTTDQEQIVRLVIEEEMKKIFHDTDIVDYKKVANLQALLIDWLDSKEDLTAGVLND